MPSFDRKIIAVSTREKMPRNEPTRWRRMIEATNPTMASAVQMMSTVVRCGKNIRQ